MCRLLLVYGLLACLGCGPSREAQYLQAVEQVKVEKEKLLALESKAELLRVDLTLHESTQREYERISAMLSAQESAALLRLPEKTDQYRAYYKRSQEECKWLQEESSVKEKITAVRFNEVLVEIATQANVVNDARERRDSLESK